MLGYTIQVGNLSPRPSISVAMMPFSSTGIPAYPEERRVYPENRRDRATVTTHLHRDSCLKQQLRSCAFFADSPHSTYLPPRHSLYYNLSMPANMLPALWRSSGVTFRALWRIARQVFHEFAGAMFIVFAVYGVMAAWRQWKTRPVLWLIGFAIVYALMMTIFGLVSFRRARRIR